MPPVTGWWCCTTTSFLHSHLTEGCRFVSNWGVFYVEFVSVQIVQVDEPAPSPRAKYNFCTGPLKALDVHVPPVTSHPICSFFLLSFLFSYFCHILHSLPLLSLAFRPPPVRTHSYVKTSISTVEHRALSHVGTGPRGCAACQHRLFLYCFKNKKKKIALYFTVRCPIKYAPTNKSPLRSGLKRLLLWKPLQTAAAGAIMRHRAVFWHLISRRTQGSISQTSPPGSHFIISAVPIRTLTTAAAHRLLPSYLFISVSPPL